MHFFHLMSSLGLWVGVPFAFSFISSPCENEVFVNAGLAEFECDGSILSQQSVYLAAAKVLEGCDKFFNLISYTNSYSGRLVREGILLRVSILSTAARDTALQSNNHTNFQCSCPQPSLPPHPFVYPLPAACTTLLFLKHLDLTNTGVLNVAFHS